MEFIRFRAEKDDENRRFDRIITKILPLMPSSLIQKNIRTGFIRLNGKKNIAKKLIKENDEILIVDFLVKDYKKTESSNLVLSKKNEEACFINKKTIEIKTIFKNEHLWIVDKDSGILSQKAKKNDYSLNCALKEHSSLANSLSFTPSILHRLDKDTSGLIVFSQSLKGAQWFSSLIQENKIEKKYLGIVEGKLAENQRWEDKIDDELCISEIQMIEEGYYKEKHISLLEFRIITGKKHQIRKQSALHSHPLLGDKKYGGISDEKIQSFALHAYKLGFPHNDLDIALEVFSQIPKNFHEIAKLCLLKLDSKIILG